MFRKEIKKHNKNIYDDIKEIDKLLIDIKVNMHDLEKLGDYKEQLLKDMDFLNIDFYKLKVNFKDDLKSCGIIK